MTNPSPDFREMVVRRRDSCVKFKDDKPSRDRKEALRFYRGDHIGMDRYYGDSADGLSTVVSRDTMEAVESMMPSLVRPFVAGEEVVTFEPVGPEDEDGANQATDYINHVFTTHNNAFQVVHDSMKDGLLYRLGIAKTVVEEAEDGGPEKYEGLSEFEVNALQTMGREFVGPVVQDEATQLFSVTLPPKKTKRYRVYIIAPDEFLYEERLASLDQATFLGQTRQMQLCDLIALGVDEAKAKSLKSGKPENSDERDQRFDQEDEPDERADDDLARPVWVDECYVKTYVGEGSPCLEWRKVLIGGSQSALLNGDRGEAADDHPYSVWTPIPVPHKLVGLSVHDMTRDIQMNKTALQREMNNNAYLTNRPQREILDGQVNIEDLLNPIVGGFVRVKQQNSIRDLTVPFVAGGMFPMIEYLDSVREARTGVTRYNQGMDTNSLNKTATGMNIIANASQQRQELVARQYAEFLKSIFKKLLGLVSTHGSQGETIRLRGKWVEVDPTDWKTSYDMTVSVGLGTNNKDQLVGHLMSLLDLDERIVQLQQGANGPLVTMSNIYEKLKRIKEAMGLKGDKYYTDPDEAQQAPQQPQPDPSVTEAQTEIAKEQIRGATDEKVAHIKGAYDYAGKTGIIPPMPEPAPPAVPPVDPGMADPGMVQ